MADEKIKSKDFVEIDFVGKANNETFDTNIKEEAEKISPKMEIRPLIICVGQGMLVKGFDKEIEGKEIGKKYTIKLSPEESFGKRNSSLVRIVPARFFKEKQVTPYPGMMLNVDGMVAKIISVSGGRVTTDFNNPLAGKEIEYSFTIKRKITDEKEKVDSLQEFFFKQKFNFKIENNKVIFSKEAAPFIKILGPKFKEILGKEIEFEKEEKKPAKDEKK